MLLPAGEPLEIFKVNKTYNNSYTSEENVLLVEVIFLTLRKNSGKKKNLCKFLKNKRIEFVYLREQTSSLEWVKMVKS